MADRGDTHYHVPHLNLWFLVASLAFLATMVWTVIDDWNAEWKQYQREFRELELSQAEEQRAELERAGVLARRSELEARVDGAEAELAGQRKALAAAEEEARQRRADRWKVEQDFKKAKAVLNWDVYQEENEILAGAVDPREAGVDVQEVKDRVFAEELAFEDATREWEAAKAEVAALKKTLMDAEAELSAGTRDLAMVEDKIAQLAPTGIPERAAKVVRDFPGLDFIGPNMKVQKYVLPNLTFELNFTKKTRIDMCTTCHMGIDREGFEDAPQPHTTHPNLDLYLTSRSPHPAKDVGCTICHRGSGESLSFQHADHRPSDAAEAKEWNEEYHWHKQHHWDYPMLSSDYVEASCVQCHTTSMELIADDAPHVTEGYRLFERYGCYSCHKVEWFPTKRKPGPSLKNLRTKLDPEFVAAWVAAPKAFRPTTWMPQLFHLENIDDEEVIVKSRYGKGPELLGRQWNDTAVAAVTTYLFENHPEEALPPIPVEGDAERGREAMNLVGCYACHNTAVYEGEDPYELPGSKPGEFNDKGPNLRGVATKTNATWLYNWLKDPAAYWSETRMPNLRLSDQDASDITAYIMEDPDGIFTDVADGWEEGDSPVDVATLQEMARWWYTKLGRREIEKRLGLDAETGEPLADRSGAEWADPTALATAVGEALVRNHGCYSCHEIKGYEDAMPIGTELTNWGSKTVDKLDFAMHYRKEVAEDLPMLDKYYREGWLERKLHRPRSYDLDKIKSPKDKLRMPWFDFTADERQAIATFVVGLVDDEVQRAKMVPTPKEIAMDTGLRAIRQKNCMACHSLEPGEIDFEGEDGTLHTVRGELTAFTDDPVPPTMQSLDAFQSEVAKWEEYFEEEMEEVYAVVMDPSPDIGLVPAEKVEIPMDALRAIRPPQGGAFVRHVTDYYKRGGFVPNPEWDPADEESYSTDPWTIGYDEDSDLALIEDVDGVQRNYSEEEYDKVRWTFAPPVLWNEGHKLQREWFYAFLHDPTTIRAQLRVRMPTFTYSSGEAEAIADYFAAKARDDWYVRYAKTLRTVLGREPKFTDDSQTSWDVPEQALEWPTAGHLTDAGVMSVDAVAAGAGLTSNQVRDIERGYAPAISAGFDRLFAWGNEQGFGMTHPVPAAYELTERRTPSHLAAYAYRIPFGARIAAEAVNCYQCHPNGETYPETPIAWAPPLPQVIERLREEWVREWLWSPKFVYPGTAMPDNFAGDPPQYQDVYPDSSNRDQIQAVLDWLYNMDRPVAGGQ